LVTLGCCCGMCMASCCFQAVLPPRRSPTESETIKEIERSIARCGAHTGEISVTLAWSTKDDLDLMLVLPSNMGTISAENPECCGGRLDIDGNNFLQRPNFKPIEHIYWPHYSVPGRHKDDDIYAPPSGKYHCLIQVAERQDHAVDIDCTLVVTVMGRRDVHHIRIVPGTIEVDACTFHYRKPRRNEHHDYRHRHRDDVDNKHGTTRRFDRRDEHSDDSGWSPRNDRDSRDRREDRDRHDHRNRHDDDHHRDRHDHHDRHHHDHRSPSSFSSPMANSGHRRFES